MITYRGAKISSRAADLIEGMQTDAQYSAEIMKALSDAINHAIICDDMDPEDADVRSCLLINLAMVSKLMKELLNPRIEDEL